MAENMNPESGPAWQGPLAGGDLPSQDPPAVPPGTPPAASPGDGDLAGPGHVPAAGAPAEQPGSATARPSGLNRRSTSAPIVAGAMVVAVAGALAGLAVAEGVSRFNIVLILIVAGVAVAELMTRTRAARLRDGTPEGRPLRLINLPAGSGERASGIAGILIILAVGAVMGILSFFAVLELDACPAGSVGNRCDTVIGVGWLVLMATQVLIFFTALLGAAYARSPGQMIRAIILGLAGPIITFGAFSATISGAIPS